MTKTQTILDLLAEGRTTQDICRICNCMDAYVRAVRRRQRNLAIYGSPSTPAELATNRARAAARLAMDPEHRARTRARCVQWHREQYRTNPEFRERRKAYDKRRRERRKMAQQGGSAHGH